MKYHLNIIDGNVDIPKEIDIEYNDFDNAYDALEDFVHSFDYEMDVCGRIIDENGEDVDYCNSFVHGRYTVEIDGEFANDRDTLDEAIDFASHLFGKGYTDDVQIYDHKNEEYVNW